jgi:hypothetical protein
VSGSESSDRFVLLRGGVVVPVEPFLLLLDLEARGISVSKDSDSISIAPRALLADADRTALRRWKWHLLLLIDYCAQPGWDAHLLGESVGLNQRRIA